MCLMINISFIESNKAFWLHIAELDRKKLSWKSHLHEIVFVSGELQIPLEIQVQFMEKI